MHSYFEHTCHHTMKHLSFGVYKGICPNACLELGPHLSLTYYHKYSLGKKFCCRFNGNISVYGTLYICKYINAHIF